MLYATFPSCEYSPEFLKRKRKFQKQCNTFVCNYCSSKTTKKAKNKKAKLSREMCHVAEDVRPSIKCLLTSFLFLFIFFRKRKIKCIDLVKLGEIGEEHLWRETWQLVSMATAAFSIKIVRTYLWPISRCISQSSHSPQNNQTISTKTKKNLEN